MRKTLDIQLFVFLAVLVSSVLLLYGKAAATTVQEVAHDLECPCECPLVLEDCNMSCGLEWKDQIGEQIKAGKTKDEIVKAFIAKYGDAARMTPTKRIKGKVYQYTRRFDTKDWIVLGGGVGVWFLAMTFGVFLVIRRFSRKKGRDEERKN